MSQLPDLLLHRLHRVADDLRETFAERAYRIDVALGIDPGFGKRSGHSRSYLSRDLALDGILPSASANGVDHRGVRGGRELRDASGGVDRRFRILKASRTDDGFHVIANTDSALRPEDDGGYSLFPPDPWVFGWTQTDEPAIEDVFAGEIVGFVEGSPGHLVLGTVHLLGQQGPAGRGGFMPVDEPLDGFEDESDLGDEEGGTGFA